MMIIVQRNAEGQGLLAKPGFIAAGPAAEGGLGQVTVAVPVTSSARCRSRFTVLIS